LPCLIRTLPAVTCRDQLIYRHRRLVSRHSTAIPSTDPAHRPSSPTQLTDPAHRPSSPTQLTDPAHRPSSPTQLTDPSTDPSTDPAHRPNFLPSSILDSTPSALEEGKPGPIASELTLGPCAGGLIAGRS
jgi:hypothetical protein